MPTLQWLTKEVDMKAARHVPYRLLEEVPELGHGDPACGKGGHGPQYCQALLCSLVPASSAAIAEPRRVAQRGIRWGTRRLTAGTTPVAKSAICRARQQLRPPHKLPMQAWRQLHQEFVLFQMALLLTNYTHA